MGKTMNETEFEKKYVQNIYTRNSIMTSIEDAYILTTDKWEAFDGCFYLKDNKSFCFDSYGCHTYKFLLNQLPTPITFHNFKSHGENSILGGTYCLYLLALNERINYHNAVLKNYFVQLNAVKCTWKQFFLLRGR